MCLSRKLAFVALLSSMGSCAHAAGPGEILFVRGVEGSLQLRRLAEDGSNARPFTTDTSGLGAWTNLPDRSADGSQVLFTSGESGSSNGVYIANADGSNIRRLDPGEFAIAQWPAWSPDGGQVLFDAGPSPTDLDLYLMNADGSQVRQLTSGAWADTCGRWSPDGRHIVYTTILADTTRLMTLDLGTGASEVTLPSGFDGVCADWSPDGRRIAFSSWPDFLFPPRGTKPWESSSVFLLDLETNRIERVTHLEGLNERPRWSRDGQWITFNSTAPVGTVPFSSAVTRATEIYLIRPDGSDLRRLTRNEFFDGHPVW
jgi:TolB protein